MLALPHDLGDPAAHQSGRQGEQQSESPDGTQRDQSEELAVRTEEDRDRHDGQELADRPSREDVATERAAEHVIVAQDRQQGAQGGGGQGERNRNERPHQTGGFEQPDDGQGQDDRHGPADQGEPAGLLSNRVRSSS